MLWDFMKSKKFNFFFSVIVGVGLVAILRPACNGPRCITLKAPPVSEIRNRTYQLGTKCYQFTLKNMECPKQGVIEAFR